MTNGPLKNVIFHGFRSMRKSQKSLKFHTCRSVKSPRRYGINFNFPLKVKHTPIFYLFIYSYWQKNQKCHLSWKKCLNIFVFVSYWQKNPKMQSISKSSFFNRFLLLRCQQMIVFNMWFSSPPLEEKIGEPQAKRNRNFARRIFYIANMIASITFAISKILASSFLPV